MICNNLISFEILFQCRKKRHLYRACADLEGVNFDGFFFYFLFILIFLVDEGRKDQNTTISGP